MRKELKTLYHQLDILDLQLRGIDLGERKDLDVMWDETVYRIAELEAKIEDNDAK